MSLFPRSHFRVAETGQGRAVKTTTGNAANGIVNERETDGPGTPMQRLETWPKGFFGGRGALSSPESSAIKEAHPETANLLPLQEALFMENPTLRLEDDEEATEVFLGFNDI